MRKSRFGYGIGSHEVIIESPNHCEQPPEAPIKQLVHMINAYRDRLNDLSGKSYVRYVQIFRNYGQVAGASLSHPHSQIIATPFVPAIVEKEQIASRRYYNENDHCVFCKLLKEELQTERFILDNG